LKGFVQRAPFFSRICSRLTRLQQCIESEGVVCDKYCCLRIHRLLCRALPTSHMLHMTFTMLIAAFISMSHTKVHRRCYTMMCKACAIDSDWNLSKKIDVRISHFSPRSFHFSFFFFSVL
jgi:hypothetical protein